MDLGFGARVGIVCAVLVGLLVIVLSVVGVFSRDDNSKSNDEVTDGEPGERRMGGSGRPYLAAAGVR